MKMTWRWPWSALAARYCLTPSVLSLPSPSPFSCTLEHFSSDHTAPSVHSRQTAQSSPDQPCRSWPPHPSSPLPTGPASPRSSWPKSSATWASRPSRESCAARPSATSGRRPRPGSASRRPPATSLGTRRSSRPLPRIA